MVSFGHCLIYSLVSELLETVAELLLSLVLELLETVAELLLSLVLELLKMVSAAEELLGFFPDEEETSEVSVAEVSVPVVSPTRIHLPSSQK